MAVQSIPRTPRQKKDTVSTLLTQGFTVTKKGILYGIGVGPGDPELLTLKAVRALKDGLDPQGIMNPGKIIPAENPQAQWGLAEEETAVGPASR